MKPFPTAQITEINVQIPGIGNYLKMTGGLGFGGTTFA